MEVLPATAPDFDAAGIGGRRIPFAALTPTATFRRRSSMQCSGQRRMSVSSGEGEDDEAKLATPRCSRRRSCSSESSPGSSLCGSDCEWPSSAGSGEEGEINRCRRRPSISELSNADRMTPEANAIRGAGFPWRREIGLCKLDYGSRRSSGSAGDLGESEREQALAFCLLATPELRSESSPLQQANATRSPQCNEAASGSDEEQHKIPGARQRSFEEQVLQASSDLPISKRPSAERLQPPRLWQWGSLDAGEEAPRGRPSPPARPPQKRLRAATAVPATGGG